MKTTRYCLNKDAKWLNIHDGTRMDIPFTNNQPVFVDILEPMECEGICTQVKVKAFFPDGTIAVGSVVGFGITIHGKNHLYDGRFNSDKI